MKTFLASRCLFLVALLFSTAGSALAYQDPAPVRRAVEDFLKIQTKGQPTVSYTVGTLDPANQLPPCTSFSASLEGGNRLWGRTKVTVRCQAGTSWALFIPVQIKVRGEYLVASHSLAYGRVLSDEDLETRLGDLAELPPDVVMNRQTVVGRTLNVTLAAGQVIRSDALRAPIVVQQGQQVTVISRGAGFQVSSEGQALNSGSEGQVVRIRMPNGQVISGLAKGAGTVEINH